MDSQGNLIKDGEIHGLFEDSNGRSCCSHECCGEHLRRDDIVRFVATRVPLENTQGASEDAVAAIRISDGTETCRVGFLPRRLTKWKNDRCIDKFAQIIELYDDMEEAVYKRKSKRCIGVASFRLLDDIPSFEKRKS